MESKQSLKNDNLKVICYSIEDSYNCYVVQHMVFNMLFGENLSLIPLDFSKSPAYYYLCIAVCLIPVHSV